MDWQGWKRRADGTVESTMKGAAGVALVGLFVLPIVTIVFVVAAALLGYELGAPADWARFWWLYAVSCLIALIAGGAKAGKGLW